MAMEIIVVARDKSVMAKCKGADEYVRDGALRGESASFGGYVRRPCRLSCMLCDIIPAIRNGHTNFPEEVILPFGITKKSGCYFNSRDRRDEKAFGNHVVNDCG